MRTGINGLQIRDLRENFMAAVDNAWSKTNPNETVERARSEQGTAATELPAKHAKDAK